ncbi:hypothetical protein GGF46_005021 [Coemansia sp. RSA 552]|nr:hypothetical protein GGF46_005021 [Coemansia sp. RSA 552]
MRSEAEVTQRSDAEDCQNTKAEDSQPTNADNAGNADNTQRYDRQLRLWQKDGQAALERARVVVLGSTALASESLKNLVLPGIGEFVVVDDAVATPADARSNFFVYPPDVGQPRAQCVVRNLAEMNPDVRGRAEAIAPAALLDDDDKCQLLAAAALVVCCAQPEHVVRRVARWCWDADVPVIAATAAGFQAEIRTAVREHTVIESHAAARADLRVTTPFAALRAYADAIDLAALDSTDLAHVPLVVLLIKAWDKWAAEGNPTQGLSFPQLRKLAELVRSMAPAPDEENFEEAAAAVNVSCASYRIPDEVAAILDDPAAAAPGTDASNFWLLVGALRRYVASQYAEGMLPLSGTIPDMKADTSSYVKLQRIYKDKAEQDKAEFATHLRAVLQDASLPAGHVSEAEVDSFCKNASRLRLLRTLPIHHDVEKTRPGNLDALASEGAAAHYALFRAADLFRSRHGRYPGAPAPGDDAADLDTLVEQDTQLLATLARELMSQNWGMEDPEVPDALAAEFARSGHLELHNVSAVVGGIVAQESIKLITHQYVPHNSTCILDMASSTFTFTA